MCYPRKINFSAIIADARIKIIEYLTYYIQNRHINAQTIPLLKSCKE